MFSRGLIVAFAIAAAPVPAHGQSVVRALGGATLGGAIAIPVTAAYATFRAHTGSYIFNGEEGLRKLVWIPVLFVGAGTGVALAASEGFSIPGAAVGALGGGLLGATVGRGVAQVTASSEPGRWGGLVMGLGLGTVIGAAAGGLIAAGESDDEARGVPLTLSIAVP